MNDALCRSKGEMVVRKVVSVVLEVARGDLMKEVEYIVETWLVWRKNFKFLKKVDEYVRGDEEILGVECDDEVVVVEEGAFPRRGRQERFSQVPLVTHK
jgi:hypothetical protein